jgi:hypothetical protein
LPAAFEVSFGKGKLLVRHYFLRSSKMACVRACLIFAVDVELFESSLQSIAAAIVALRQA